MAVIVRRKNTANTFVLIGAGLGAYAAARGNWLFGELAAEEGSDVLPVVAVADAHGEIVWISAHDVEVVTVDGQSPADLLSS
jgi:hypothetical protein